jgi:hypothetical protein
MQKPPRMHLRQLEKGKIELQPPIAEWQGAIKTGNTQQA